MRRSAFLIFLSIHFIVYINRLLVLQKRKGRKFYPYSFHHAYFINLLQEWKRVEFTETGTGRREKISLQYSPHHDQIGSITSTPRKEGHNLLTPIKKKHCMQEYQNSFSKMQNPCIAFKILSGKIQPKLSTFQYHKSY